MVPHRMGTLFWGTATLHTRQREIGPFPPVNYHVAANASLIVVNVPAPAVAPIRRRRRSPSPTTVFPQWAAVIQQGCLNAILRLDAVRLSARLQRGIHSNEEFVVPDYVRGDCGCSVRADYSRLVLLFINRDRHG